MLTQNILVKDQFGIQHHIQATIDRSATPCAAYSHIKHITVEGEDIRPSFEMFFQSTLTAKIFKIVQ